MADDATPQDTPQEPVPQDPPATDDLGDAGKKALEAERRARREAEKRAQEYQAKFKEFEDRDKSEFEKLRERFTEAEQVRIESERRALRLEVAFEKGLTPAQAKRLVGTTREELEADADEILRDFPVQPVKPSGDIGQGPRQQVATPTTPEGWISAGLAEHMK